jgi:hypothetical protein
MTESVARYEFKYLIDIKTQQEIRKALQETMECDPHVQGEYYSVNSLYFDTPDLKAYYEKLDGIDPRVKIRLRYYGTSENFFQNLSEKFTFFLEAKYRKGPLIRKERLPFSSKEIFLDFIEGPLHSLKSRSPLETPSTLASQILEQEILAYPREPFCLVSYRREPYICRVNPTLRVTFDTHLQAFGASQIFQTSLEEGLQVLPQDLCIMEIKFHWAIPLWLLEICQQHGVVLRRYSKYCSALERLYPELTRREIRFS